MEDVELLSKYYIAQAGSGGSTFYSGPIYQRGSGRNQRGAGIGSFLGGLFRRILPVLRKGTVVVGREVINSGTNFIDDLRNNVTPQDAMKKRSKEAVVNLVKKAMNGGGYKGCKTTRKRQSTTTIQTSNTKRGKITKAKKPAVKKSKEKAVKKVKRKPEDIFSKHNGFHYKRSRDASQNGA